MKKTNKKEWFSNLKKVAIMSLMLIASSATAQLNGTYTVQDDSPTAGTNFNNVKDLSDTLKLAGVSGPVTINILPDTFAYEGQLKLINIPGLSSTNTLTINGNNQEITSEFNTVILKGVSYVTLNGMKVRSTGLSYSTVWFEDSCRFVTFQNGEVITEGSKTINQSMHMQIGNGTFTSSTATSFNSNITIKGNTLHSNGSLTGAYAGIVCQGRTIDTSDQKILIEDNTVQDFGFAGYYGRYNSGVTISRNEFSNNLVTVSTGTKYGVYISNRFKPNTLNVIEKNSIKNLSPITSTSYVYGIYYTNRYEADNAKITNNTVSINTGGSVYGIRVLGAYTWRSLTPGKKDVINNSIYVTGTKVSTFSYQRLIQSDENQGNVQNNLMYCDAKGVYANYGLQLDNSSGTVSHNNVDLRDMTYNTNAFTRYYHWINGGMQTTTPTEFTNSAISSTVINPRFDENLVPLAFTIAGKGKNILLDDFNSTIRDTVYSDMGAYELEFNAGISGSLAGSVECSPYTENVTVTINNFSNASITDIPVTLIGNGISIEETVTDTIVPFGNVNYTFATPITLTGNQTYNFSIYIGTPSTGSVSNTVVDSIRINTPVGFAITPNSNFGGYINDGNVVNPDIVAFNYPSSYDVTYPSNVPYKYTLAATKAPGTSIDTTGDVVNSGDTLLTVNPSLALQGDLLILSLTAEDSITGCIANDLRFIRVPFCTSRRLYCKQYLFRRCSSI